jgi:hypothetical protein
MRPELLAACGSNILARIPQTLYFAPAASHGGVVNSVVAGLGPAISCTQPRKSLSGDFLSGRGLCSYSARFALLVILSPGFLNMEKQHRTRFVFPLLPVLNQKKRKKAKKQYRSIHF